MSGRPTMPTKAEIERARSAIEPLLDQLDRLTERQLAEGERHPRSRYAANVIRMRLMGSGGCVIAPFDERWVDDRFRAAMREIYDDPDE